MAYNACLLTMVFPTNPDPAVFLKKIKKNNKKYKKHEKDQEI